MCRSRLIAGLAGREFEWTPATPAEPQESAIFKPKQVRQRLPEPGEQENGGKLRMAWSVLRAGATRALSIHPSEGSGWICVRACVGVSAWARARVPGLTARTTGGPKRQENGRWKLSF